MAEPSLAFHEIQRDEIVRMLGVLLKRRVQALPLGILATVLIWMYDPLHWRRNAMVAVWTIALFLIGITLIYIRRGLLGVRGLQINFALMAAVGTAMFCAFGGVDGPAAPGVLVISFLISLVQPGTFARITVGSVIAALGIFSALQTSGRLPGLVPPFMTDLPYVIDARLLWCRYGALAWIAIVLVIIGEHLRRGFDRIAERASRARDEELAERAAQMRTLTSLTGEIAHELKNPLASIKGLAALVAQDLEGRPAEQLGILRREVDRMQGILEEFLNFSRPLVPLTQERTALRELGEEVLSLLEVVAASRGVVLALEAPAGLTIECDRRKVKQVLINLLGNAIEASPRGGQVRLRVRAVGEQVELAIADEGPGIDPSIAQRLFEPGCTTKAGGTGLGLTISRLIARQHGGELAVGEAPRGCLMRLCLPRIAYAEQAA